MMILALEKSCTAKCDQVADMTNSMSWFTLHWFFWYYQVIMLQLCDANYFILVKLAFKNKNVTFFLGAILM